MGKIRPCGILPRGILYEGGRSPAPKTVMETVLMKLKNSRTRRLPSKETPAPKLKKVADEGDRGEKD